MKKASLPKDGKARNGFEIFFKEDGMYYFRYNDSDGEPMLFSKGYPSEAARDKGIQMVIDSAGSAGNYEYKEGKSKKYLFVLKSEEKIEIGRSRLFATRKEMDKRINTLKQIDNETPVFDTAEQAGPKEEQAQPQKSKPELETIQATQAPATPEPEPVEILPAAPPPQPIIKPPVEISIAAPEQAALQDDADKMARYKFSVIYYPNSAIWVIKNDFTGESKQLKTCDGQQIEAFLKAQLPVEEPIVKPAADTSSRISQPKPEIAPPAPKKDMPGRVKLTIRTIQGETVEKKALKHQLHRIEAVPQTAHDFPMQAYEAKVMARSLDNDKTFVIGTVNNQKPVDDRFVIPLYGAQNLNPGTYLFITKIFQNKETAQVMEYYGSQLVVLN